MGEISSDVFPNPIKDKAYLLNKEINAVSLTDAMERVWPISTETQPDMTIIDTSGLPTGIYLLSFETEGRIVRRKILIQH